MKKIILLIPIVLILSQITFAASYEFSIPKTDLRFSAEANDEFKAREIASEKCFNHFTAKKKITREYGMAAVDVCINLR